MTKRLVPCVLIAAVLGGCATAPVPEEERRAFEQLGDRADQLRDGGGLEGADREAFFWLVNRAARRHTVGDGQKIGLDLDSARTEWLADRVRRARAAQRWPWAPRDEDTWRRGVLMYRVATEKITDWAAFFLKDAGVAARVDSFSAEYALHPDETLRALIHYLNGEVLGARLRHESRKPPDLDPESCLRVGGGRATDLAVSAICLMRTFGIPAVLVRAPLLAGEPSGDAWIAVIGTPYWIRPADGSPLSDDYFSYRRKSGALAKVYAGLERNDFADLLPYAGALSFYLRYQFVFQPAADVTDSLPVAVPVILKGLPEPAFLSMWAGAGWLEVVPGRRSGEATAFGSCGADGVLYLPTSIDETSQAVPAGDPFVLHPDGAREVLRAGSGEHFWKWEPPGDGAEPRMWSDGAFRPCAVVNRAGTPMVSGAPGALYVVWKGGRPVGRPFTVAEDGAKRGF